MRHLAEIAEQIVFGQSIADKLTPMGQWTDEGRGPAIVTPKSPGRVQDLRLQDRRGKHDFPSQDALGKECGKALHFFANHELLALELMGLVLLRFPDAPIAFRRGVAVTIADEQRHLSLYLDRMASCGVQLGDYPLNGFFWKCISEMNSPLDFVSRLSLTFEQANLDYAQHYEGLFRQLGDADTAAILAQVYKDEIAHVRHGVNWLHEWQKPGEDDWQTYERGLAFPMTPARAKGIGFNREGRLAAGLSEGFVSKLRLYSHSKGRAPDVYRFNPSCEAALAQMKPRPRLPAAVQDVACDLELIPMYLAAPDDIVMVDTLPSASFLETLVVAGFEPPRFVLRDAVELRERALGRACPWGWSPDSVAEFADLDCREKSDWQPWRELHSKAWSSRLLGELLDSGVWPDDGSLRGRVVNDFAAAESAIAQYAGEGPVLLKAPLAAAGRHQQRVVDGLRTPQANWAKKVLAEQGELVVERLLDKVLDLSLLMRISQSGAVKVLGWTRFETDGLGRYKGTRVTRPTDDLSPELLRFLYAGGAQRLRKRFHALGTWVGKRLAGCGYRGPAGIDLLVYRGQDGLAIKPIVEVNPRFTMGHVALKLRTRVPAQQRVSLRIIPIAKLQNSATVIELTDPAQAKRVVVVLETHSCDENRSPS
jgi:uncharacterized ferritin-like protein (DUF455 family)